MPHWEIFLGLAGLGVAIFSYFSTHMGINIPLSIAWGGGIFGILILLWAIILGFWGPQRIPIGPVLIIIISFSGIVCGGVWLFRSLSQNTPDKHVSSKLILSVRELAIEDPKNSLTMDLLFNNDGTKEFIIDQIYMLIPWNLRELDDNDNIFNNFNDKAKLEYKRPDGKVYAPACYSAGAAMQLGFPKILKPTELFPLKITIPFTITNYFKKNNLVNINKIPIGLLIWIIDYKGQRREIFAYPIAQIIIINDNEMQSMAYRSPTTFNFDIEDSQLPPSRVGSIITPPGGVITPGADTTDLLDIKIK